jgi:hypothetical protein
MVLGICRDSAAVLSLPNNSMYGARILVCLEGIRRCRSRRMASYDAFCVLAANIVRHQYWNAIESYAWYSCPSPSLLCSTLLLQGSSYEEIAYENTADSVVETTAFVLEVSSTLLHVDRGNCMSNGKSG